MLRSSISANNSLEEKEIMNLCIKPYLTAQNGFASSMNLRFSMPFNLTKLSVEVERVTVLSWKITNSSRRLKR